MGMTYFLLPNTVFDTLADSIAIHESDQLGPRARGGWFDSDDVFDYAQSRSTATDLYEAGVRDGNAQLTLSENEAQSLSMLDIELPADGQPFPPTLFSASAGSDAVRQHLKTARRKLGSTPDVALARIEAPERDPRLAGYLHKRLHHLNEALPKVWGFYQKAADAGQSVLVVDLRARDLAELDEIEREALWSN